MKKQTKVEVAVIVVTALAFFLSLYTRANVLGQTDMRVFSGEPLQALGWVTFGGSIILSFLWSARGRYHYAWIIAVLWALGYVALKPLLTTMQSDYAALTFGLCGGISLLLHAIKNPMMWGIGKHSSNGVGIQC